jgi:hypothetical protein
MSEYDDLRRTFDDLAGQPPLVLGRKEAVMNRISRRLQRQAAVRGAGVLALAAVIGMGAVQTTLHLQQTSSDSHGPAAVVTTTSTPTGEPTHHETSGHEPSRGGTHSTEPTTGPTTAPVTGPTQAPSQEPTRHATEPSKAPTPEDTSASGPLAVSVEMSPSTVDTSTDTHALVTARDGEGRLLAVDIDWGDGKTFHFAPGATACPRTTHLNGSFNHRYTAAGSYTVHVTVTTGDCAPTEQVTRESHVTVTGSEPSPATTYTNGPSQPTASAASRTGDNPTYVYLNAGGGDSDGWVRLISVSWGDGTTTTAGEWPTSSCTNATGSDHPDATHHDGNVSHHYGEPGSHTVTITVTSVACDGSHVQTGTTTSTVTQSA